MAATHKNEGVSDAELLNIIHSAPGEHASAREVANHVTIGKTAVLSRLKDLAEEGSLEYKKPSQKCMTFWLPEAQSDSISS